VTSPFGPLVIIANPSAGRGRVGRTLPDLEAVLRSQGLDHRIALTRAPGHATELARGALLGGERFLVAVGGDGTVHEVVNGMLEHGRPLVEGAVLGVVAAGSGCDFVRTFDLPGDAVQAGRRLGGEDTRTIDVVRVSTGSEPAGDRYFVNVAEAGIGGATVQAASRLPRWIGRAQYVIGFWMVLPRFQRTGVRLDTDGQVMETSVHNVVVANARYYGGGMQISPKSSPEDGVLEVLAMVGPKRDAFTILAKVYRGTHLPHPNIVERSARRVRIDTDRPLVLEADGEVIGTTPVEFEVLPGALRLKV
jgi:diacylglycerol kinase (ATP)